jgi:hypothetical protein
MKIIKKETGFRYISYEIEDGNKKYSVIKAFGNYPSLVQAIRVEDQEDNLVLDENIIEKINKVILEYNS